MPSHYAGDLQSKLLRLALLSAAMLAATYPSISSAAGPAAPSEAAAKSSEARLKHLEDLEEIRNLRMMYHYYINEGKWGQIPDLYTADAYVNFQRIGGANGIKEIRALFDSIGTNVSYIKQFIHNHIVDIKGDTATGTSYFDARYAQGKKSIIAAGTYREKYRRTPDGWRISEMLSEIDFAGTVEEGWAEHEVILKGPDVVPRPESNPPRK